MQWITRLAKCEHPVRYSFLCEMAQEIVIRRQAKHDFIISIYAIDEQWTQRFLQRHPELQSIMSCIIEISRIKEVTKEMVQQ